MQGWSLLWSLLADGSGRELYSNWSDLSDYTASCPGNQGSVGEILNGLLFRNSKICVTDVPDIWLWILRECHDSPIVGHPVVHRTLGLVKHTFYWPKIKNYIEDYVVKCQVCQVNKTERLRMARMLHPLAIPSSKCQIISMDFITGLPRTSRGHHAIWVIVDRLTKMARFVPTITTTQLAQQFV